MAKEQDQKVVGSDHSERVSDEVPKRDYSLAEDLLEGAQAIADFGGWKRRQVYHFTKHHRLPVFRLGTTLCARKSRLVAWIEKQEASAGESEGEP